VRMLQTRGERYGAYRDKNHGNQLQMSATKHCEQRIFYRTEFSMQAVEDPFALARIPDSARDGSRKCQNWSTNQLDALRRAIEIENLMRWSN